MSLAKFENSIVDHLIGNLVQTSTEELRQEAYSTIKFVLEGFLHDSVCVKPFGSGPLKTYLPQSDIDITILFKNHFFRDQKLATKWRISTTELNQLKDHLESVSEEHNIEDVTIVNASVKIIKLYWNAIPIDISFNQIGGICAFNYLEKINELVGKDNLF